LFPKQDVGLATLATRTCINRVSRVLAHTFEFSVNRSRSPPHNLLPRVPLGRFAGLKHRQAGMVPARGHVRRGRGDWRSRADAMQQRRGEVGGWRAAARVPLLPRFLRHTRPSAELLCSLLAYLKSIQPTTTLALMRGTGGGGGSGLPSLPSTDSGGGDGKPAAPSNLPGG
jgi:hypothetical protein